MGMRLVKYCRFEIGSSWRVRPSQCAVIAAVSPVPEPLKVEPGTLLQRKRNHDQRRAFK